MEASASPVQSCISVNDLTQDEVEFRTQFQDEEYRVVLPTKAMRGGLCGQDAHAVGERMRELLQEYVQCAQQLYSMQTNQ